MTFLELMATTPAERWASLSIATRDAIGAKLLESHFAELVQDDDGLETTEAERNLAAKIHDEAFNALFPMIEAAFPSVMWCYPGHVVYEARNCHGDLIGIVTHAGWRYRFTPVSPRMKRGRAKDGLPADCLPRWAQRAVKRGGWFGAVFADGRRYPDDFRSVSGGELSAVRAA